LSKIKVLSTILVVVMALTLLTGCGSKEEPTQETGSSAKLTDGTFNVEYENFDSHGYKPQLEVTIVDGKITVVKYDEIMEDGTFKSQDPQYKTKMEEASGNYPEKAFAELQDLLIAKQDAEIDAVSGATASSKTFITLAKHALDEMSRKGVTTPTKIAK